MQAVMNLKIKFRESFRPFAPIVLRERVARLPDGPSAISDHALLIARGVAGITQVHQLDREAPCAGGAQEPGAFDDHMRGLQSIRAAFPGVQILAHPHARDEIVATQERWLKRRVTMVPNIRKAIQPVLEKNTATIGPEFVASINAEIQKRRASQ